MKTAPVSNQSYQRAEGKMEPFRHRKKLCKAEENNDIRERKDICKQSDNPHPGKGSRKE